MGHCADRGIILRILSYGAKKACEPLHIQYSYDDHSVVVVNNYYKNYNRLQADIKIYNMDMTEKYHKSANVNVKSDGKSEVLKIEWPDELSKTFFLSLKLEDSQGQLVSDNIYWLSTTADVQGSKEHIRTDKGWGILKAKPKSFADFTGLNDLQKVKLDAEFMLNIHETVGEIDVSLKNPADKPAFMVMLAIKDKRSGNEIMPVYWQDNYFTLLPGDEKKVSAEFSAQGLEKDDIQFVVSGWNVE